ncbi:BA75_03251T0 [Komagataella pastoris]|uniref:BA75_03251T0 n=1 Tax=Komagataella pastoris TaxID=4922 RepID=A0A1B2JCT3_PICPA|nr:BA75_03251T0 [Komagataella pastoris]
MITPFFTVTQDDEFVFIDVKISNIRFKSQNIEIVVDDNLFIFSLQPYYLRLRLPGPLVDDERAKAEFVSKDEKIAIKVPKLNPKEDFKDLDLTAKLLARVNEHTVNTNSGSNDNDNGLLKELSTVVTGTISSKTQEESAGVKTDAKGPLIQEIGGSSMSPPTMEQFDFEIEQKMPTSDTKVKVSSVKYGFNNQYENAMAASLANGNDINELSDPDTVSADDRIMERLIKENIKFDIEYYASNFMLANPLNSEEEDSGLRDVLAWESPVTKNFLRWSKMQQEAKRNGQPIENIMQLQLSEKEQKQTIDLPRRSYLISDPRPIYYTTLSLLFAYCFDLRENLGENNIESAWTIGKLSPQLSCLDTQLIQSNNWTETNMLKVVVLTSIRRALCYPLHRNYDLILKTWDDVYYVLRSGKRQVLKYLLAIRELFRFHDVYYVYKMIWLDDLSNWALSDSCDEFVLRNIAHELRKQVSQLSRSEIVFEKTLDPESDELEPISIEEIEQFAKESVNT